MFLKVFLHHSWRWIKCLKCVFWKFHLRNDIFRWVVTVGIIIIILTFWVRRMWRPWLASRLSMRRYVMLNLNTLTYYVIWSRLRYSFFFVFIFLILLFLVSLLGTRLPRADQACLCCFLVLHIGNISDDWFYYKNMRMHKTAT